MDARLTRLSRRTFLADLGKGFTAVAVFGLAACTGSDETTTPTTTAEAAATTGSDPTTTAEATTTSTPPPSFDSSAVSWERVSLGFVSAYVLARPNGRMTLVDAGTGPGSIGRLTAGVEALGGTWADVDHVIATHSHGDHIGALPGVLTEAPQAQGYAGTDDLAAIPVGPDLIGLEDGDEVDGFQIVAVPGHTPGSIAVYDPASGLLVAGDAVLTSLGEATGPAPEFTADLDTANASAVRLAELQVETLLVGHGDPIVDGAGAKLAALAQSLG